MFCSNCGCKLDKGQKFCTNCGTKNEEINDSKKFNLPKPDLKNLGRGLINFLNKNKFIILGIFVFFIFAGIIAFLVYDYQDKHLTLDIVGYDESIYIDKNGKEYFSKDFGTILYTPFFEGRMFVFEPLEDGYSSFTENNIEYTAQLYELGLIDKTGEVIARYEDRAVLVQKDWQYCNSGDCYVTPLPKFYKGYARVGFVGKKSTINSLKDVEYSYLNRNGDFVSRVPKKVKEVFENNLNPRKNMYTIQMPCEDGTKGTCVAITDKNGKQKTKAIYATEKKINDKYVYSDEFSDVEIMYLNKDMKAVFVDKNGKQIYNQPFAYSYGFGRVLAQVIPVPNANEGSPNYYINKNGKRVWSNMKPTYIYNIKKKKWIAFDGERLGNKYLDDCIYLSKDEYSYDYENPNWIVDQDFKIMYEYDSMNKFAGNDYRFDTDDCVLKDGRLFHYEWEGMKLYELVYNNETKKLELVVVTDRKTLSKYFNESEILYVSDFKNVGGQNMEYEVTSTYPKNFMIYNDVVEDKYLFYRHYYRENPSISTFFDNDKNYKTVGQFTVSRPTTVYFIPDGVSDSWYNFKIVFK